MLILLSAFCSCNSESSKRRLADPKKFCALKGIEPRSPIIWASVITARPLRIPDRGHIQFCIPCFLISDDRMVYRAHEYAHIHTHAQPQNQTNTRTYVCIHVYLCMYTHTHAIQATTYQNG